jgi:MerR family transcriptional regulator, light-induced transcriptional regulator
MAKAPPTSTSVQPPALRDQQVRHRSGAVARMLRMPVATLRVWERRYRVAQPVVSPSGQRLYSADDVRRLALIKQLCELGHAIGGLAPLDMAQLQAVAATHAQVLSDSRAGGDVGRSGSAANADHQRHTRALVQVPDVAGRAAGQAAAHAAGRVGEGHERAEPLPNAHTGALQGRRHPREHAAAAPEAKAAWRVAVIGAALASRLGRPAVLGCLARPLQVLGPFADAAAATLALADPAAVDLLLVQEQGLQPDWLSAFDAAAPSLRALPKAVLYGFAPEAACTRLGEAGVALLRQPQPDTVLGQWVQHVLVATDMATARSSLAARPLAPPASGPLDALGQVARSQRIEPRRWSDAALADFAGLSSTIACECPRHVAELLMLLSHFEAYSAECQQRSSEDAALHVYLGEVAAGARMQFEDALHQVALREGLILPAKTT